MRVEFTQNAEQDLIDHYLYGLAEFGQQQADQYEAQLRQVFSLMGDNPTIAHERTKYKPPVRIHHTGKHYVVYCVETKRVLVLRVLRDEVDLARFL